MRSAIFLKRNYFLLTLPVDLVVVLFTIAPKYSSSHESIKWLLLGTLAHCGMLPFFLFNFSNFSLSVQRRMESLLLLIAGGVRGYAIVWLSSLLELPDTHPTYLRILNSAINVPIWFFALYLILDTRKGYQRKFQERFTRFIASYMAGISGERKGTLTQETIEKELQETLEPLRLTLEAIAGKELSPKELAKESEFIAHFIQDEVRPLSHKLWKQAGIKPPKIGLARLIQLSLLELDLPLAWVAFPAFIYQVISASTIYGFTQALLRAGIGFGILMVIFGFYRILRRINKVNSALLNFLILLVSCTAPNLLIRTIFYPLVHPRSTLQLEVINFIWYAVVLMATSLAFGFYNFQERILAALDLYNSKISESVEDQSFARYIHTDLQSGLLASSIDLSRAAESKDSKLGREAIERAAEILRRDHRRYAVGKAIDPRLRFEELVKAWNGIATIEIENADSIVESPPTVVLVSEILEELVANSVRHGQATHISTSILPVEERVHVRYSDDGTLNTSTRRGLGTEILDLKALNWSREVKGGVNVVHFELPFLH